MSRIINVNKQLEELEVEPHKSGVGFNLKTAGSKTYIEYNGYNNNESTFPNYSVYVTAKKKLFGGYIINLRLNYTTDVGVGTYDRVLNPHCPVKLKSDMLEYTEWIEDTLVSAFEGEF